jgi:carboxymethylenebutenolidase
MLARLIGEARLMDAKTALAALLGVCSVLTTACGSRDAGQDESGVAPTEGAAPGPADAETAAPAEVAPESRSVELVEQNLAYGEAANSNLIGYLAMPADAVEPLPGLIIIHEQDGLDDDIRAFARRLAAEGYIALAIDLYGGAVAHDTRDVATRAGVLVEQADATLGNIRQAYDYLTKYAFAPSVAAIGWSLGGTWALRAGVALPDELDAVVMYYGQFATESDALSRLTAPVLGHFAGLDESIPPADARLFRARLLEAGRRAEIYIYPEARPGFANPNGAAYDAAAADEAWRRTVTFLEINL